MNADKLKDKIIEKDLSIRKAADLIGIHESSLYRKLNNSEKMTIGEAVKLKDILGLKNSEAYDIFLN